LGALSTNEIGLRLIISFTGQFCVGNNGYEREKQDKAVDYIQTETSAIQTEIGEGYWIGIALFPLALGLVIGGIGLCVMRANRVCDADFTVIAIRAQRLRYSG